MTARRLPPDLVAFAVIVVAMIVSHASVVNHGMLLNDVGWYFHFGQRVLAGDVPYRDFVFQVGPLPMYVDAAFQRLSGEGYLGSLYAAIALKTLRVFVIWLIVRRIASWQAAALFSLFCALDLSFGWIHHWSTPYSQLFYTLSGLCLLIATRATSERRVCSALALAGACAGLIIASRQSTAIMTIALLAPASTILLVRKDWMTWRRYLALWCGVGVALGMFLLVLALLGNLGPALQQMFFDAPQKKSVHGLNTLIDPLSGGSMVLAGRTWWGGFLSYLALPTLLVVLATYSLSRDEMVPARTVALLAVPFLIVVGLFSRFASLDFYYDVPRMLLSTVVALAVLAPDRLRRWLGLEPLVALGLLGLPLASDWANELSLPGRGWGDITGLIVGAVLCALASSRLASRTKTMLCAGFAVMGLTHLTCSVQNNLNPYARDIARDGSLTETSHTFEHPLARGIWVNAGRKRALEWLAERVRPGSTCFMYGNLTAIYDFLECKNPTRIDTTITDFVTVDNAEEALRVLHANPPEFLIAQERSFTNPSLEVELASDAYSSPVNPAASRVLHMGLRALLPRYESVGLVSEVLGPELDAQVSWVWDGISATRLYRRKQ